MRELEAANVGLVLHEQAIDTTTPAGRLFYQIAGAFAEFERSIIRSRVMAGLARARAQGKKLGRPRVGPRIERAILAGLADGKGILKLASGSETRLGAIMNLDIWLHVDPCIVWFKNRRRVPTTP